MTTESTYIKKCKRNDADAQRSLYIKYKKTWYTICLRYCQSRHEANDVLQESLVKIFSKISQFNDKKGSFKAWSSKIIVNECVGYIRSETSRRKHIADYCLNHKQFDYEPAQQRLNAQELVKLIQELPNGYRLIFNLYAMEGYTHKEIANKLNIAEGTSKSQYSKAKKLLQSKVEQIINYKSYERV